MLFDLFPLLPALASVSKLVSAVALPPLVSVCTPVVAAPVVTALGAAAVAAAANGDKLSVPSTTVVSNPTGAVNKPVETSVVVSPNVVVGLALGVGPALGG